MLTTNIKKYDKYKDSGIEWIGEIPQEWKLVKTGRVFRNIKEIVGTNSANVERLALTLNGVIKRDKDDAEGLQPEQFDGYQYLRKNQMVFKLIDLENVNTSRVGLCPFDEGMVSPAYIVLKSKQFDNRYYHYYFLSLWHNEIFNHLGGDGVRSALNAKDLLNIPTFDLSIEKQQTISNYLDDKCQRIDSIIETEKAVIELLKEYKQSVITEAVTKGLDKSVPLKDSGIEWIGKIPEHWEVTQISKLYNIILGKMLCTKPISDTDTLENYLCSANIKFEGIKTDEIKQMYFNESEKKLYLLNQNDVLISEGGDAGTAAIYNNEAYPCYIQNAVHKATAYNKQIVLNKFLYYWMFFCKKCGYIDLTCNKATIMHYTKEKVSKTPIVFISRQEQQQIADYLDKKCSEIDKAITGKEQLIEKLAGYKKSLIYECVTGKRKVVA